MPTITVSGDFPTTVLETRMWGVESYTDDADGTKGPTRLKRLTMRCYILLTIEMSLLGVSLI
jgi:hypothetical protein